MSQPLSDQLIGRGKAENKRGERKRERCGDFSVKC
jgi:hypothetical protein